MLKAIIVYESKYGNTKLAAEKIGEGMKQVSGVETVLSEVKEVDLDRVTQFDTILIGSPNHIGRATASIRKLIDNLGKLKLEGNQVAVFDTYMGGDFEKAVKKMEKQLNEKVPGLKLTTTGLSIRVKGTKGPIMEGELPKCEEFGARIATKMKE